MDTFILLLGIALIACAIGLIFLYALAISSWQRRRRNTRRHELGRLLKLSHTNWN